MASVRGVEASNEFANELGGQFLQLEDGESVIAAFAGIIQPGGEENEPKTGEVVWEEGPGGSRSVEYDPAIHDKGMIQGQFSWNVYLKDTGEVKILQRGLRFFKKFYAAKKKGLITNWFEILREGTGLNTTYYLTAKDKISERDTEDILGLELQDLDRGSPQGSDGSDSGQQKRRRSPARQSTGDKNAGAKTAGNGVVSDKVAAELRQSLKDLPNATEAMAKFKTEFKVGKLKELPSGSESEARKWLIAALAVGAPVEKTSAQQEVDPFE